MGCGSSRSDQVIRSAKVAPMPMEDAPPTSHQSSAAQVEPTTSSSQSNDLESNRTKQLFVQQTTKSASTASATVTADGKRQPSPTPSRKSTKSLSSRSQSGLAVSGQKHGGSNRSLASLRTEERRRREQVEKGGSASSLQHKRNSDDGGQNDKQPTPSLPQTESKASMRTADSGLGGDAEEKNGVHVTSGGAKVIRITDDARASGAEQHGENDDADRPPTPDLAITGMAIQARKTGSAASRRNNMQCLETPDKDTSIIQRPPSRGGMAFDIMVATPDTGNVRRAPSRLRQLERRPSIELQESSAQLRKKQVAAERRRQQYEKENILSKVEAQRQRSNQVQSALQAFAARQSQQTEGRMLQNQDKQAENREAHLKALRERLKAKEDHARKVREAKAAQGPSAAVQS